MPFQMLGACLRCCLLAMSGVLFVGRVRENNLARRQTGHADWRLLVGMPAAHEDLLRGSGLLAFQTTRYLRILPPLSWARRAVELFSSARRSSSNYRSRPA